MIIYDNGIYREAMMEDLENMASRAQKDLTAERSRPLTEAEIVHMLILQKINTLTVDDNTALRMVDYYPKWERGKVYEAGDKVQYGGKLWSVLQAHTSQEGWEPSSSTASLWAEVCETHDGTADDPIPYTGNMVLDAGKYYIQDSVIYRCIRNTGNPVYNTLKDLTGLYVETV